MVLNYFSGILFQVTFHWKYLKVYERANLTIFSKVLNIIELLNFNTMLPYPLSKERNFLQGNYYFDMTSYLKDTSQLCRKAKTKVLYLYFWHSSVKFINIILHCNIYIYIYSFWFWYQFSSVAQSCPTLCHPMDCRMPGFLGHHQLLELTQTHVHRVGDAIQSSHLLSSPSPPAFNLFQHHNIFQWVSSPHQVAGVLEFQLRNQSFQWVFRTDFL